MKDPPNLSSSTISSGDNRFSNIYWLLWRVSHRRGDLRMRSMHWVLIYEVERVTIMPEYPWEFPWSGDYLLCIVCLGWGIGYWSYQSWMSLLLRTAPRPHHSRHSSQKRTRYHPRDIHAVAQDSSLHDELLSCFWHHDRKRRRRWLIERYSCCIEDMFYFILRKRIGSACAISEVDMCSRHFQELFFCVYSTVWIDLVDRFSLSFRDILIEQISLACTLIGSYLI